MELLKLLSTNEIVAQIISFLILLILLRIFAWKKLLALLDKRREKIANEFKLIDQTKQELSSLKADYDAKISDINAEARLRVQEAIEEGKRITDQIRKKAHENAQDIIEEAKANIKYELAKAKVELKEKIVDLTIASVENVIQEKLTDEQDRSLVRDFLDKIEDIK